ncbi:MAG: DegV family protein [Bacillus subtilis]|nr:DegV family protein [Bacillus subtilis]
MVEGIKVTVLRLEDRRLPPMQDGLHRPANWREQGKSMARTSSKNSSFIRDNNHIYFAVTDLKYLVKNGRLSNAAGFIADVLKIKPLLEVDKNGAVVTVEKIRTFSQAVDRVIEKFLEETVGFDVRTLHHPREQPRNRRLHARQSARGPSRTARKSRTTS